MLSTGTLKELCPDRRRSDRSSSTTSYTGAFMSAVEVVTDAGRITFLLGLVMNHMEP